MMDRGRGCNGKYSMNQLGLQTGPYFRKQPKILILEPHTTSRYILREKLPSSENGNHMQVYSAGNVPLIDCEQPEKQPKNGM